MEAPTDLETARQLATLWRRVSEGITKASEGITQADGVLEQAREVHAEVQTGISRAQAVQSEIAELVGHSRLQVEQVQQLSATLEHLHNDVVQVQSEVEKLHQAVVSTVNELGGTEGLESLSRTLLQAHSATQETASRVEHRSSEVSNLAQQVRADREAIQSLSSRMADERHVKAVETLVHEQGREIERLNKKLHDSHEELRQIRNWLLGVTLGVALALALAIALVGWR